MGHFEAERYSYSALSNFQICEARYWLKYVAKAKETMPPSDAISFGRAFHKVLEQMRKGEDLTADDSKVLVAAQQYLSKWGYLERREAYFCYRLPSGILLHGFADGVDYRAGMIVENKTGTFELDRFTDALQWRIYCMAFYLPVCEVRHIPRPTINCKTITEDTGMTVINPETGRKNKVKHTRPETREEFEARLAEWYKDNPLQAHTLKMTDKDVERTESEIEAILDGMQYCSNKGRYIQRRGECSWGCPYKNLCNSVKLDIANPEKVVQAADEILKAREEEEKAILKQAELQAMSSEIDNNKKELSNAEIVAAALERW